MSEIWKQFKEYELTAIGADGIENEAEIREINPDLYDAALCLYEYDDLEYLSRLVNEKRIDINKPTVRSHQPLLFLAIVKNRVNTVKFLIDRGANVEHLDEGKDYVFWAIFTNCDISIFLTLLETKKFKVDTETLALAIRKTEVPQINLLIERLNSSELDQLINEGDESLPMTTSIFEALVYHNFYLLAEKLLTYYLPNTWEKLRNDDYLNTLDQLITSPPLKIDFSSASSRKRSLPPYSKEKLLKLKEALEKVLYGKI